MRKKFLSMLAAMALISSQSICGLPASAKTIESDVSIQSLYTKITSSVLSISGTTARMESEFEGYSGVTTKVIVTQTLQKKNSNGNWTPYAAYSDVINGYRGTIINTKSGLTNGTYRLKSVFVAYSGSKSETTTKYSYNKTI